MSELPAGFVLDEADSGLPPGFVLDEPATEAAPSFFSVEGQGRSLDRRLNAAQRIGLQAAKPMSGLMALAADKMLPEGAARDYYTRLPLRVDEASAALGREAEQLNPPGADLGDVDQFGTEAALTSLRVGGPLVNRLAQGGAVGAALSPGNEGAASATGAVVNAAVPPVLRTAARMISPQTTTEAGKLYASGVRDLTPGMAFGQTAKAVEDKLASVPFVGDVVRSGQRRAVESYNTVEINKALAPIGAKVGGAGREAIAEAQQIVDDKFDDLLPNLRVAADPQFIQNVTKLRGMAQNLPPEQADKFNFALNEAMRRFTPQGRASGQSAQDAMSKLTMRINDAFKKGDVDSRDLGGALKQLKAELIGLVDRSNPSHAGELTKLRQSYAMLARVEDAAARAGSKEGVFSPTAMMASVRKGDKSARKRATAAGRAQGQELAERAETVMGQKVPDSGTVGRALIAAAPFGVTAPFAPAAAASGLAASLPYMPGANRLFNALLFARPPGANALARGVNTAAPFAAPVALPASNALLYGGN